jgi:hypothetical protein
MPPDQFLADAACHRLKIESAGLGTKLAVKNDLQQKVAQFFPEIRVIARVECRRHFISFLQDGAP